MKLKRSYLIFLLTISVAIVAISCGSEEQTANTEESSSANAEDSSKLSNTPFPSLEDRGLIVDDNRFFPQYDSALEMRIKDAMREPNDPNVNLYDYFVLKETISTKKDSTYAGLKFSWALIIQNVTSDTIILKARLRWETERNQLIKHNIVHGLVLAPDSLHTFTGIDIVSYPQARNVKKLEADVTLE